MESVVKRKAEQFVKLESPTGQPEQQQKEEQKESQESLEPPKPQESQESQEPPKSEDSQEPPKSQDVQEPPKTQDSQESPKSSDAQESPKSLEPQESPELQLLQASLKAAHGIDVVITSIDDDKSTVTLSEETIKELKELKLKDQKRDKRRFWEEKKKIPPSKLTNLPNVLKKIISLADAVIKDTDKDALLAFYGIKCDTRPDAAKIKS